MHCKRVFLYCEKTLIQCKELKYSTCYLYRFRHAAVRSMLGGKRHIPHAPKSKFSDVVETVQRTGMFHRLFVFHVLMISSVSLQILKRMVQNKYEESLGFDRPIA